MIYVTIPHLMPIASFVTLMLLMDRSSNPSSVFPLRPKQSLSFMIYNDLRESGDPLYGSGAATSLLTIIGVVILLTPVLLHI